MARKGRDALEHRVLTLERGINRYAEGSVLISLGETKVNVTVSLENRVPLHVKGTKKGWLMAEYSMLPRATHQRTQRETQNNGGRRAEIQRLMGRAFRTCLDLELFRDKTVVIDADVLQADGGTRVTSILGGYAALFDMADRLVKKGTLLEWPLTQEIGAVSVGLVGGEIRLDLDYNEDAGAEADLNVVATSDGKLLEVQGGTEKFPLPLEQFYEMVRVGVSGVGELLVKVKEQLK